MRHRARAIDIKAQDDLRNARGFMAALGLSAILWAIIAYAAGWI